MYTLDTNAIIYYVQEDAHATSVLEAIYARNVPVYVSVMTEAELFALPTCPMRKPNGLSSF